ncbi:MULTISPECIES: LLM class flavin-dependent oxidoreductase [unclassified Streptomyces]|uniref:LLM class flavin-dependent oxidoreductase n=1 Tax=unclassified Streptomyces TaxID=2593676 RepID=UPI000380B8EC|nr:MULTISPECIES: LLM class flavin-dependent oxidoreductase [unclassified Streptomyces]
MDLDVLYEIDVPKPWKGSHPHGQRAAEQRACREAVEQIRLADKMGFRTVWAVEHHFREGRSHCPAPDEEAQGADPHVRLVRGGGLLGAEHLVDGVHPGDEGHARIAAAVAESLRDLPPLNRHIRKGP